MRIISKQKVRSEGAAVTQANLPEMKTAPEIRESRTAYFIF